MSNSLNISPNEDLQKIFDSAPENTVIRLAPGEYRQKAVIRTPGLTLIGSGMDQTVLVWDDYALKTDEQGREYNTFRTWTIAVCADNVHMENLAIVNDALHPETKGQEVALSVLGDNFSMENCLLRSTQDTLFSGPLPPDLIVRYTGFHAPELLKDGHMRQVFTNCHIEGTVDFIFGCGDTLFADCEIKSLYDVRNVGYVAAPAHTLEQQDGFVFRNCRFTFEDGVEEGSIYLARPWRDHGLCLFENCSYGRHISPLGFDKWNDTNRDQTARFRETPAVPGRVTWANKR
ncbi:MAG: hypothetical protein IJI45_01280 [Anaerolineaceae bacterium]|nr:hypothetical protein [Anaerolineaceae bacterium]